VKEIRCEAQLARIAHALSGNQRLTTAEKRLLKPATVADSLTVKAVRELILAGQDPLGDCLIALRSPELRRDVGAVYTPAAIVDAMIGWAASKGQPARVVDPGCGSGRFTIAAAGTFPNAKLVACDIDPLAVLLLRANAVVLGFADRLEAQVTEYRSLEVARIEGRTLYIGNPPYVRHHKISGDAKDWFGQTATKLGFAASKLAGLHVHFFLRTREIAREGDWGAFITAAEWMDVNYGSVVRQMLSDGLGGSALHIFRPEGLPFDDAMTTGVITTFAVGERPKQLTVRELATLDELNDLKGGRRVSWEEVATCDRWSTLTHRRQSVAPGMVPLGNLFRVHRGSVTGANDVFIEGEFSGRLPGKFLVPAVTKAKELFETSGALFDSRALRRIIALPSDHESLSDADHRAVERFKKWARQRGAHQTYTAKATRAWWSIDLREPAPILCTYMARRAPTFVRNIAGARHINIAHGLYPRTPMTAAELDAYAAFLRENVCKSQGRTYAGGLTKFEPKEIERLLVPTLDAITRTAMQKASARRQLDIASELG
jgi:adenine-specific DNA-methyltransferase